MLVRPDDGSVHALFPLRFLFWRSFLGVEVSPTSGVVAAASLFASAGLCFFPFLCFSAVCIPVVQRSGVDSIVCIILM